MKIPGRTARPARVKTCPADPIAIGLVPRPLDESSCMTVDGALLDHLRIGTRNEHRRLDHHELLRPLLLPTLSRPQYLAVLRGFYGFYELLEPRLQSALLSVTGFSMAGYRYIPRLPLLRADLLALSAPAFLRSPDPLRRLSLPALIAPEQIFGTLYVLEGSTQGGKVIGAKAGAALRLQSRRGLGYFDLQEQLQWQRFKRWLSRHQHHLDWPQTVQSARETFRAFDAHLDYWVNHSGQEC